MYSLKEITNFIHRPINILHYAPEIDLMDDIVFINGNMNGYNISHLKFSITSEHFELIRNVDVNNLNDALEISDAIFGEKSNWTSEDIEYNRCKGYEEDFKRYVGHKNNYQNIEIAVMMTRFKNSNSWIQLFMEDDETELSLHSSYIDTIAHLTLFFTGGECD